MRINNILNLNRSHPTNELPKDLNISAKAIKAGDTDLALINRVHAESVKPKGTKPNIITAIQHQTQHMLKTAREININLSAAKGVKVMPDPRHNATTKLAPEETLINNMEVDFGEAESGLLVDFPDK